VVWCLPAIAVPLAPGIVATVYWSASVRPVPAFEQRENLEKNFKICVGRMTQTAHQALRI